MVYESPFSIDIPKVDLLTYLFPSPEKLSDEKPLWISAANPSIALSGKQSLQWIRRLAVGLEKLHLEVGDVVLMISPNQVFVPILYAGTIGYGAVFSGLTPAATVNEMIYQLKDTEAKAVMVHPSAADNLMAAAKSVGLPKSRIFLFSDVECKETGGLHDWRSMMGSVKEAEAWQWQRLTFEESRTRIATINYSSGTTGLPKGVCVSHHNLIANVEQLMFMSQHLRKDESRTAERWLNLLPLYHAFGQMFNILMACRLGLPNYIMAKFHYEDFLAHVQTHKITNITTAPPILVMLSKRPETPRYDVSSLKHIVCGGAPLSKELQNEIADRFGILIAQTWGGTELTCSATMTPGGVTDEKGSAGALLPNIECKLLDDNGKEVGVGERGEACFKGPNVCLRYWKNEAATANAIRGDRFYHTGDVAIRDERGMFYVVDRKKELIKVAGYQVAPAELEALLLENEHIADAGVVGITIDDNELPRAFVVLKAHAKGRIDGPAIQAWLAERVARYKRLQGGVVFIDEVPKSASGKIQRKELRKWVEEEQGAKGIKAKL